MTATSEVCVSDVCGPSAWLILPSQSKNNKEEDAMVFIDVQIQTNPRPAPTHTGEQTFVWFEEATLRSRHAKLQATHTFKQLNCKLKYKLKKKCG